MKNRFFAVSVAFCLVACLSDNRLIAEDAAPDSTPAQTPPRETKLKAVTVVYRVVKTTPEKAPADFAKALSGLRDAMKTANLVPAGGSLIIVHGPFGQNADTITADTGIVVADGSKAPGDDLVKSVPSDTSFASVYFGPADGMRDAITQLFVEAHRAGRATGDELRQHMLHWEGAESPNNVVLLELVLKP